jgi:hypothetical protein
MEEGKGENSFANIFIRFLFSVGLKRAKYRNMGERGGKECMYIKDWLKPIFPVLLT